MEKLSDFISTTNKNKLKDYKLNNNEICKRDYLKYMDKKNFNFYNGGIVTDINKNKITYIEWNTKKKYTIDTNFYYIFYKSNRYISKREYYEKLLYKLNNNKLKIKKI